jgi:hypothetical protein
MAVNNNGHLVATDGSVAVDFVWGNFPMQPNDERGDSATAVEVSIQAANAAQDKSWGAVKKYQSGRLDFTKGNHDMAEAAYAGFPAFTGNNDGAYTAGAVYVAVANVLGLTTALATDALKDSGLVVTAAAAATNAAKSVTAIARTAGSKNLVFTATGAGAAYAVGTKVTVSNFSGGDAFLNGTYTVTANATDSFTVQTTETTVVALTGKSGAVIGVAGTIKAQSTAAGAGNIAAGAAITITPWAAGS